MADGPWDKRSLFIETEVSEKGKVSIGLHTTEGTYTIEEVETLISRMQRGVRQAKTIRESLKRSNKRAKK